MMGFTGQESECTLLWVKVVKVAILKVRQKHPEALKSRLQKTPGLLTKIAARPSPADAK
jgi:hypothetical protein